MGASIGAHWRTNPIGEPRFIRRNPWKRPNRAMQTGDVRALPAQPGRRTMPGALGGVEPPRT